MNTSLLSLLTVAGFLTTASGGTPGAILQPDGRVIGQAAEATVASPQMEAELARQGAEAVARKERALRRADEIRAFEYENHESMEYRSKSPLERQLADTITTKMMLEAGIPAEDATYYIHRAKLR